ncbi:MAG: hypothetical protein ACXW30_04550 [Micavibrio sp.]
MRAHPANILYVLTVLLAGLILCALASPSFAQDRLAPAAPSLTAPAETLPEPAPLPEPQILGAPVDAQSSTKTLDLGTGERKAAPSDEFNPADIPDILMDEMKEIENSCRSNYFYSSFHDCRCIAVKFLDARIRNEPGVSRDMIFKSVAAQCPDEVSVAGFVYRSCYDFMKFHRPYDYREFCTCSARQMAAEYTASPLVNLRYMEQLRKKAYLNCGLANAPEWRAPVR